MGPHRVGPHELDVSRLTRERLELGPQALVDLDYVQAPDPMGDPLGQRAGPASYLEDDVLSTDPGLAHDRVEEVRIGEEVLSEPPAHHPNSLAAFASTASSSRS